LETRAADLFQLFRFIADKDLYAELYREALAKRLLSRRCASVASRVVPGNPGFGKPGNRRMADTLEARPRPSRPSSTLGGRRGL
jgi:hypothetical protein